jgi:hypothetical protein
MRLASAAAMARVSALGAVVLSDPGDPALAERYETARTLYAQALTPEAMAEVSALVAEALPSGATPAPPRPARRPRRRSRRAVPESIRRAAHARRSGEGASASGHRAVSGGVGQGRSGPVPAVPDHRAVVGSVGQGAVAGRSGEGAGASDRGAVPEGIRQGARDRRSAGQSGLAAVPESVRRADRGRRVVGVAAPAGRRGAVTEVGEPARPWPPWMATWWGRSLLAVAGSGVVWSAVASSDFGEGPLPWRIAVGVAGAVFAVAVVNLVVQGLWRGLRAWSRRRTRRAAVEARLNLIAERVLGAPPPRTADEARRQADEAARYVLLLHSYGTEPLAEVEATLGGLHGG